MPSADFPMAHEAGTEAACPVRRVTDLGPVAESYDELHRIDLLAEAIASRGVPQASHESAACAVFQSSEVCLLNLARLAARTRMALLAGDVPTASRYVQWTVGFHHVLRKLGATMFTTRSIFGADARHREGARVSISDTAGYRTFMACLHELEDAVRTTLLDGDRTAVRSTLAMRHIDDPLYRVLHGLRISYHDATKWESDLADITLATDRATEELMSSELLARAVASTELDPQTLHGEFVALHQVPEILCAEANDHLEVAIGAVRADELSQAVEHLSICRALLEPMVEAQRVMAELLATGEYHEFRENLGPASGIHSLTIKQHMFKDLFKHLWTDLHAWLEDSGTATLDDALRHVDEHQHDDSTAWLRHSVVDEAFRLHAVHQEWRHEHLHMPRNCLGSGGTKSMIGVPDGPQAVYRMRDVANAQRSLRALHEARRIKLTNSVPGSSLTQLVTDPHSVDARLMAVVGEATREFFPQVQEQSYKPFHSGAAERMPRRD